MRKILHVYSSFNIGGTEKVIMSIFDNIDKNENEMYFLARKEGQLDDYIVKNGGKLFFINDDSETKYSEEVLNFFSKYKFDVIHVHTDYNMGLMLKLAKEAKIPERIVHSHNARVDIPKLFWFLKRLKTREIEKNANKFLACSEDAARWLFPRKYKEAMIIPNPIDLQKYRYTKEHDVEVLNTLKYTNGDKIIISVGRLSKEKNHIFLLRLFKNIVSMDNRYKLVILGDGPLYSILNEFILKNHLENNVFLMGSRDDVEEYLKISDVFVLPSLHEGLGIVAIEAQTNGICVIASSRIPSEADLKLGLFKSIDSDDEDKWINRIIEAYNNRLSEDDRIKIYERLVGSNYDVSNLITKIYN